MRLAYLLHWDISRQDGVARKIETQAAHWRRAGHEVTLVELRPGNAAARSRRSLAAVAEIRGFEPDLLYLRYDLFLPPVWLLALRQSTVLELNTDDRAEWRLRSTAAARYNELNRRVLLGAACGAVAVSHELAPAGVPAIVLGNGMDAAVVPALPAPANAAPVALFIGSPRQPWHGLDKIVQLARALPEVRFEFVGPSTADLGAVPSNVRAHGMLAPAAYAPLLASADVALGTLALHRKKMQEASPLKVREYLLSGIPTVIGYDDTDLRGIDAPWLLRLPNVESNVLDAVSQIRAFVSLSRGLRVPRPEVEPRLDAGAKEARRLAFLESVVASRRPRRLSPGSGRPSS